MMFLNKNYHLSFACALLVTSVAVVPCPADSPELKQFRAEFYGAMRAQSGLQIAGVIKKYDQSLCAVDLSVALFLAHGYILGQLNLKKYPLAMWAIAPSEQKDVMIQQVKALESSYAELQKLVRLCPRDMQYMFDMFSKDFSIPFYHELLVAGQNLSFPEIRSVIDKYAQQQPDDTLRNALQLGLIYIGALEELRKSENDMPTVDSVVRQVHAHLELHWLLRHEEDGNDRG